MDQFGRAHAGKDVDTASFVAFLDKSGKTAVHVLGYLVRNRLPLKNGASAFAIQSFHEERDRH